MYHLDENQTVAHFFPLKSSWKKKLSPVEHFFSCLFPSGGLCFKGKINVKRFLDAMQIALESFDFLFCQIYKDQDDLYARYSSDSKVGSFIQLELDTKDETINAITFPSILPYKVDERITRGVADQLEGLPMCAFRLTQLTDGFVIGYYINHTFLDQSSTTYFFKYLSHLYTYGKDNLTLQKPYLIDSEFLETGYDTAFESAEDLKEYGETLMGFKYTPKKEDNSALLPQFDTKITVNLNFDLNEINKLKYLSKQYVSANDIIQAVLLKIYSFNPNLALDDDFCLGFPCNMRKRCGLGEESIGNFISHPRILLKIDEIRKSTILELAIISRKCISDVDVDYFRKNLIWYKGFKKNQENAIDYMPIFSFLNCRATNWSTFNYDDIIFDNSRPLELKTPCYARFGVNVIAFDNKESKKILKTSVCVAANYLGSLIKLGNTSNLFVCNEVCT